MPEILASFIPVIAHEDEPPAKVPAEVWPALLHATSVARATGSVSGSTVVADTRWTATRTDGAYWNVTADRPGPWFVVITRGNLDDSEDMEPIVIGPFETEPEAGAHMEDSTDVEDWCTTEAKSAGYIVDDCFVTNTVAIPSHGINAPVLDEPEEPTMEDAVAHLVLAGVDPAAIINGTWAAPAPQATGVDAGLADDLALIRKWNDDDDVPLVPDPVASVWVAVVEYGSESGQSPTSYLATTEDRAWAMAVADVMAEVEEANKWLERWPEFADAHGFESGNLSGPRARAWYQAYHMEADGEHWITVRSEDVDAAEAPEEGPEFVCTVCGAQVYATGATADGFTGCGVHPNRADAHTRPTA